jgi:large subunit ribosomal protein L2
VPLNNIALFTLISNVEMAPYQGAKIARAAGVGCLLVGKINNKAILKLNSFWELRVNLDCMSTIGINGNSNYKNKILYKAGVNRNLGFRPKVRGVAKNPCDHPHGGGNGKHSQPSLPLTKYGKPAK